MARDTEFVSLIQQMRDGSREAATLLFQRYGRDVVRIVRRLLHPKMRPKYDSQDFAQSVWASFLALPADACSFREPEAFVAYLATIARNKVIDATRQRLVYEKHNVNREQSLDGSAAFEARRVEATEPRPSQLFLAEEEWQRLLSGARPRQRDILMRLRHGTSHVQIAAELGVSEKTVQRLVKRLLEKLGQQGAPP